MCTLQLFEDDMATEGHEGGKQSNGFLLLLLFVCFKLISMPKSIVFQNLSESHTSMLIKYLN